MNIMKIMKKILVIIFILSTVNLFILGETSLAIYALIGATGFTLSIILDFYMSTKKKADMIKNEAEWIKEEHGQEEWQEYVNSEMDKLDNMDDIEELDLPDSPGWVSVLVYGFGIVSLGLVIAGLVIRFG